MLRVLLILSASLMAVMVASLLALLWWVDPNDFRETLSERASQQLGRSVQLDGPMAISLFPWLAVDIESVQLGNPADFATAPPLARIGRARLGLRLIPLLRGDIETHRILLSDAVFHLIRDAEGRSNLDGLLQTDASAADDARTDLSRVQLGQVQLQAVRITQMDLATQQRQYIDIDEFELEPWRVDQATSFKLKGRLADDAATLVQVTAFSGQVQANATLDRLVLQRVVAEFDSPALGRGSLRGQAQLQRDQDALHIAWPVFDLTLSSQGLRVGVVAQAPLTVQTTPALTLTVPAATLSLNDQGLQMEGVVTLSERPQLQLRLNGDHLALPPLLAALSAPPASHAMAEPSPLDLSPLRAFDAELRLRLNTWQLSPQLTLDQVNAEAQLKDGLLHMTPLQAGVLGGQFVGSVMADFRQDSPVFELQPQLTALPLGPALSLVSQQVPLTGLADIRISLRMAGIGAEDWLRSATGRGRYEVRDGSLIGMDLRELIDQDLSQVNLTRIARSVGGETPFKTLTGELSLAQGTLTLPDLVLSANDYGMTGLGHIDLLAQSLDYRLTVQLGERLLAQLPRALREASGGTLPLQLVGPIQSPRLTMDLAELLERGVQDRLRRELESRLREAVREPPAEDTETTAPRERTRDRLLRELLERRRDGLGSA